jgi:hypothetical protein
LPTAFARGFRHKFFSKKKEKQPLPTALPWALDTKKNLKNKNTPLCRQPGLEAVGKEGFKNRQLNPPVNGYFFGRRSLEVECSTKNRSREKFPVGPVPRDTLRKGFAECLMPFAESFRPSAKPGFPVVMGGRWQPATV